MKTKQHFVPEFYLREFADVNEKLYAYRPDTGIFPSNVRDVCGKRYLHEVRSNMRVDEAGQARFVMPNYIEDRLGKLENRLAPDYRTFLKCCDEKAFTGEDFALGRSAVCFLIASLTERNPEVLKERRASARRIATRYIESGRLTDEDMELMREQGIDGELEAASEVFAMEQSLFSSNPKLPLNRLAKSLYSMNLDIVKAPVGIGFVTSSAPFCFEPYNKFSVTWLYFPLSWRYAAIFYGSSQGTLLERCSRQDVIGFNRTLLESQDLWDVAVCRAEYPLRVLLEA